MALHEFFLLDGPDLVFVARDLFIHILLVLLHGEPLALPVFRVFGVLSSGICEILFLVIPVDLLLVCGAGFLTVHLLKLLLTGCLRLLLLLFAACSYS